MKFPGTMPIAPLTVAAKAVGVTSPECVTTGAFIPPIERIRLFSDVQWEEFILEWVDSVRKSYRSVERCGGAGDMGRDVIGYHPTGTWDNYQCKHYSSPLSPSIVWLELGKLVYYTFKKNYTLPNSYFFVAPQGAGTKLSNLFKRPSDLMNQLMDHWESYCSEKITATAKVPLDDKLMKYIKSLDFSIFSAIPPLRIIDDHRKTPWFYPRFGGGLPERPPAEKPPAVPASYEMPYIQKLLDAYGDHLGIFITRLEDIPGKDLPEHLGDARLEFYSAEALRNFSRDTLPSGAFEKLQEELHSGIRDEVRNEHRDGYSRVLAVVRTARLLQITDHALCTRLCVRDRGGICHQLANDNKISWVSKP